jgi:hypothetical protein
MSLARNSLLFALLPATFLLICPFHAFSQQKPDEKGQKTNIKEFSYTSQDKRDPFEPLHLLKMKKNKGSDARKTGYELEELKLVGVLKTGAVKFAVMEDVQGRGLLFKKGDFVNKNLWVIDILENKVVMGYKLRGDTRKIAIDIPGKTGG